MHSRYGRSVAMRVCVLSLVVSSVPGFGQSVSSRQAPTLPGEWIVSGSRAETLEAARQTLRDMGVSLASEEPALGVLTSVPMPYDATRWLPIDALGLPPGDTPTTVTFHVFVSQALEPARVAVGIVVDSERGTGLARLSRDGRTRRYALPPLAAHVVERLATRLGVRAEPLVADQLGRHAQARRLLPAGLSTTCGTGADPELPASTPVVGPAIGAHPTPAHYPTDSLGDRATGAATFRAIVTEHGTVTDIVDAGGTKDPQLRTAARQVVALWRFKPGMRGSCPVNVRVTLEVVFSLRPAGGP